MRRIYFVVEGPHDVELIGKLLKLRGLKRVKLLENLDGFWDRLVPRRYPHEGDLLRRVPVPSFFASADISVAIEVAGGVDKIPSVAGATWNNLDDRPEGLGVVLDADNEDIRERWLRVRSDLPVADYGIAPGTVGRESPRAGIYLLPDNTSNGTLENLLLACAEKAYPKLLAGAKAWVEPIQSDDRTIFINETERKEFAKPAGKAKAIASCIAGVLRPGKSIQVSIQDNLWLDHQDSLALPVVRSLKDFVDAIVGD